MGSFDEWVKAQGFDLTTLTASQRALLQGAYDAQTKEDDEEEDDEEEKPAKAAASAPVVSLKAARKVAADETRRTAAIRKVCAGKHADIEAKAIEEGWSANDAELHVLRASRATGPAIHVHGGQPIGADVLECAVLQASRPSAAHDEDDSADRAAKRHAKRLNAYAPKVQEQADRAFKGRISLGRLLLEAAFANGYSGRESMRENPREVLRAAFALQASGSSVVDISGILSNTANKFLLDGFMAVEQTWRQISGVRAVNDFKAITSYRLDGDQKYVEVGASGKIESGTVTETEYTNQAKTYAKLLSISRRDLVNDDLGALNQVPQRLGRGAGLKLNDVFWGAFLDNSSFFTSDRGNFFDGTPGSLLTIDGLTEAERLFLVQTDPDGNPLGVDPGKLLVPVALKAKGFALMNSTEIRDTTASTKAPVGNPFAGRFDLAYSRYLSLSTLTGNSAAAWYLLANPADVAVIETVFLNGQESPTIETAEADFSELGISMRGFHDFGVTKQEFRAGVKSKGAAA